MGGRRRGRRRETSRRRADAAGSGRVSTWRSNATVGPSCPVEVVEHDEQWRDFGRPREQIDGCREQEVALRRRDPLARQRGPSREAGPSHRRTAPRCRVGARRGGRALRATVDRAPTVRLRTVRTGRTRRPPPRVPPSPQTASSCRCRVRRTRRRRDGLPVSAASLKRSSKAARCASRPTKGSPGTRAKRDGTGRSEGCIGQRFPLHFARGAARRGPSVRGRRRTRTRAGCREPASVRTTSAVRICPASSRAHATGRLRRPDGRSSRHGPGRTRPCSGRCGVRAQPRPAGCGRPTPAASATAASTAAARGSEHDHQHRRPCSSPRPRSERGA